MTTTAIVILAIIVVAVVLIAALVASRARSMRRPALKALAPESRDRYAAQWDRIESHFVDAPEDAVKEADALALAMLGEREHPLAEEKLPADMQKARRLATGREGKGGTEGLRQSMLMYRSVIEEYAGPAGERETPREPRREIAS
jgi:hypothetical protein